LKLEKLIDEAEHEGSIKQFINEELKLKRNYGKDHDSSHEPIRYIMHLGGKNLALVCLDCGGYIIE